MISSIKYAIIGLTLLFVGCTGKPSITDQDKAASSAEDALPVQPSTVDAPLPEVVVSVPSAEPYAPAQEIPDGGHCFLDVINGAPPNGISVNSGDQVSFGGWISDASNQVPTVAHLVLEGEKESYAVPLVAGGERPDVASILKNDALKSSGYSLTAKLAGVTTGEYALAIVTGTAEKTRCSLGTSIKVVH